MSRTAQAFGQRCPYDLVLGQLARAMLPGRGRHLGIRYGCVVPAKGVTERAYVRLDLTLIAASRGVPASFVARAGEAFSSIVEQMRDGARGTCRTGGSRRCDT